MLHSRFLTAVEQVVACALVTQRAQVRSPVGTSFLGEVFQGFSSPVRQMLGSFRPPRSPNIICHHYHPYSFITGANDLRCWCALNHHHHHHHPGFYLFIVKWDHFCSSNKCYGHTKEESFISIRCESCKYCVIHIKLVVFRRRPSVG